jgi:transcriptional regulator with XRE-family HTH domain
MSTPRTDLKEARIAVGLTQAQLADQIGKTQTVVSRYESGDYAIDVDAAPLIAAALKIGVLQVLYPNAKAA